MSDWLYVSNEIARKAERVGEVLFLTDWLGYRQLAQKPETSHFAPLFGTSR